MVLAATRAAIQVPAYRFQQVMFLGALYGPFRQVFQDQETLVAVQGRPGAMLRYQHQDLPKGARGSSHRWFTSMVETLKPEMKLTKPFPRLSYAEAMESYGTDKPDLRFGLEIRDLSDIAAESDFSIFRSAIADGGKVKGICAPGCANYSRSQLNELNKLVQGIGAEGLITMALGTSRCIRYEARSKVPNARKLC